ncbi:MAG TPA: universal stress protein, partial [Thermosynechococcaceae cyanobacterium]
WQMLVGAFVVQFVLTLVACSAEAPGGIFVPSLVLGAAIGHLVGLFEFAVLGREPIIYAITGMGAFFGAIAKVPITAIVIVFEMTTNFDLVLPLMISSVTAYLVTERLAPGSLYTHLLRVKGVFLEAEEVKDGLWARLTAADVMQRNVETLSAQMLLHEVIQSFAASHHRGFPVVDQGRLVGIITQSDLDEITPIQLGQNLPLEEIMSPQPITVSPGDSLTQVLHLLSRYKISRLPVVDRRKLIGIITRSDILQVESDRLRGGGEVQVGPKAEPSYVVYQTRSPATGRGRILLPLSNPQTANGLLKLALAIAQEHHYEIECLQILSVPRHTSPAEIAVNTTVSRRLLHQAVKQGKRWNIPVHTQIRATHNVSQAILEAVKDRHVNLLLMGWKGTTSTPGRIFGDVVDTVIRQAACDVVVVKLSNKLTALPSPEVTVPSLSSVHTLIQLARMNRWLVPIAGGPNSQHALTLLPALVSLSQQPEIRLCQVFAPSPIAQDTQILEQDAVFLRQRTQSNVITLPICSTSVSEAVIDMAQKDQCDVIVLGASREGMLQQAIHGNIPEAIARQSNCTVILVRKAVS